MISKPLQGWREAKEGRKAEAQAGASISNKLCPL